MRFADDGDIVRAHGLVAIFFAALEEEIDSRIREAVALRPTDSGEHIADLLRRERFAQKVERLKACLLRPAIRVPAYEEMFMDRRAVTEVLNACAEAARLRDEVLRAPVIVDRKTDQIIRETPYGEVQVPSSAQVYDLAHLVRALCERVYGLRQVTNAMCGWPRYP